MDNPDLHITGRYILASWTSNREKLLLISIYNYIKGIKLHEFVIVNHKYDESFLLKHLNL